jgi:hypothetical protein
LDEDLFGILESLIHGRVFAFQVTGEGKLLDLLLGVDEGDHAVAAAED